MTSQTIKIIIIGAVFLFAAANLIIHRLKKNAADATPLHRKYLMKLLQYVLLLVCVAELVQAFNPELDIKSDLLKGSALIVAILGFAAQPVIADIISGLLISIHKPFEIGDRITVSGQTGLVEDVTLRHTVLKCLDNQRVIIPNNVMNSEVVTNTSYQMKDRRGLHLQYSVSYETDVPKAIEVIRDCVAASPYTLSIETDGMREDSGPVYFLKYGDSALILDTTIWCSRETNNNKAITDVNLRVLEAFRKHGIEIPYPYFNIVQFQGEKVVAIDDEADGARKRPAKRHRRSNTVHMDPGENRLEDAIQTAKTYARLQNMDKGAAMQLELLMEESVGFVQRVADQTNRDFWIEGTGVVYRIHIRFAAKIGSDEYKKLIEVSSSGKNEAANSFSSRIWAAVLMGMKNPAYREKGIKNNFEWQLSDAGVSEEEIGRSILGALASDIRVSVTSEQVELIVSKSYN